MPLDDWTANYPSVRRLMQHPEEVLDYTPDPLPPGATCLMCRGASGAAVVDVDFGEPDLRIAEHNDAANDDSAADGTLLEFPRDFGLLYGVHTLCQSCLDLCIHNGDIVPHV